MKKTKIIKAIDLKNKHHKDLIHQTIKAGQTVVFPTETVYGIGADALNPNAVQEIYYAKGRPSDNPLIMHIARKNDVYLYAKNISLYAKKLISPDLRAGMAMIIAGLIAEGETEIDNIYQIDRGYEKIDERLNKLGAKIQKVD